MTIKRLNILGYVLLLVLQGCVEEYWPEINESENLLVVDGMITNDAPPYLVRLSRSTTVRLPNWDPVVNAIVVIRDRNGMSETLMQIDNGIYSTSATGIQGIEGHAYRVEIETTDGNRYHSPYETLMAPIEVDTVFAVPETRPPGELHHVISGLQFYLDTKPAASDSNFLMWNLEATYKYKADLKIRYVFDGELNPYYGLDSLEICWRTYTVPSIYTAQTTGLTQPVIRNFPLHYVSTQSRELFIRYSLLVNQYTLNHDAWNFWDRVRELNEEQGGLYAQQPFQIRGNVVNDADPGEVVLGRFTVAGVSSMRIFINKPFLPFYFAKCEVTEQDVENFSSIFSYPPHTWPVYATTGPNGSPALPIQACMDCRLNGGTTRKPSFWID